MYNTVVYNEAERDKKVSMKALDWVIGTSNTNIQSKVLQRIPDDSSKTMGLFSELRLVVDVTAEISNNVDVHCIVKHFDYRVEGSNRCSIIWVKFTDSSIGKTLQNKISKIIQIRHM